MTYCSLVGGLQSFRQTPSPNSEKILSWRWRHNDSLKCWYSRTTLYDVITQISTVWIFNTAKTWYSDLPFTVNYFWEDNMCLPRSGKRGNIIEHNNETSLKRITWNTTLRHISGKPPNWYYCYEINTIINIECPLVASDADYNRRKPIALL
jgi:hypothetical protein